MVLKIIYSLVSFVYIERDKLWQFVNKSQLDVIWRQICIEIHIVFQGMFRFCLGTCFKSFDVSRIDLSNKLMLPLILLTFLSIHVNIITWNKLASDVGGDSNRYLYGFVYFIQNNTRWG